MPRQNRRRPEAGPPDGAAADRGLVRTDGDWLVRSVPASAATKTYRCPGCDQEVVPGTPHVVVWQEGAAGAEDRRHWHSPCWAARDRRTPRTVRSRNAPRY
jgi:hypothetical protein